MASGGKKRVPEFLCPVKYRAGLPEHTSIFPFLFPASLPPMSALLEYGPSLLESQQPIAPPFDPFKSQLSDFTDLDKFVAGAAEEANKQPRPSDLKEHVEMTQSTNDDVDEKSNDSEEGQVVRISSVPIVLIAFDHDPGLGADYQVDLGEIDSATGARQVVIYNNDKIKLGEWEGRELSKMEHDYFVIENDNTAYPVSQRLQLKRKRH